jgi:hypothetical protein
MEVNIFLKIILGKKYLHEVANPFLRLDKDSQKTRHSSIVS